MKIKVRVAEKTQVSKKIDTEFQFVNDTLDRFGFTDTLRIDAEWNCCVCDTDTEDYRTQYYINMRNEKGASHMAAALYEMQRCGVDMAMFYDAQLWKEYGALYHVPSLAPTEAYRAFGQFSRLYGLGTECESTQDGDVYTLAVTDGNTCALAAANVSPAPAEIRLLIQGAGDRAFACKDANVEVKQRDSDGGTELTFTAPGYSFFTIGSE